MYQPNAQVHCVPGASYLNHNFYASQPPHLRPPASRFRNSQSPKLRKPKPGWIRVVIMADRYSFSLTTFSPR